MKADEKRLARGGKPKTAEAAKHKANALRRLTSPKTEKNFDGLARFLGIDPAIAETLDRAGLA